MDLDRQFTCQECKQPIFIDNSLVDLTPSAYDILQSSLPPKAPLGGEGRRGSTAQELLDKVPASPGAKETWSKAQQLRQKPEQSYVLLQDSVLKDMPSPSRTKATSPANHSTPTRKPAPPTAKPTPLSQQINSHPKLFNLLSSRTDVDHPLCEECTHVLITNLTKKLEEIKRERDGYIAFEREMRKEREKEKSGPSEKELDEQIARLKLEEEKAAQELRDAEAERVKLESELQELEREEEELAKEEEDFFTTYNTSLIKATHQEATLASLRASLQHSTTLLSKLEKTNVYNDAFCIGVEGPFGTINGLRFGRTGASGMNSSAAMVAGPVEWAEVNAAWGLVVLCLKTVARKVGCEFESYTLNPLASTSSITYHPTSKSKGETYALNFSSDVHLGRLLHNRRFDTGMVMFLDCLRIVMEHAHGLDSTLEFPYMIQKDKIGEVSIKLQFSQEEVWTKALRHVLLSVKIVLRWMTNGG